MTPAEARIRAELAAHGRLSFARFMALALHDPEVGYYSRATSPLGALGDYFTSPQLHPAFAALLARQVEQLWQALDRPDPFVIVEGGPGSGLFARDLLDRLRSVSPGLYAAVSYRLDEASPSLRREQRRLLEAAGHRSAIGWVEPPPARSPVHLLFANELLDALPVHLVQVRGGRFEELFVALSGNSLTFEPGEPSEPDLAAYFERLGRWPAEGCRAEVNLAAEQWLAAAATAVERGLVLLMDYGYPAERLYSPERRLGTLLCYYRHTLGSDPLVRIGQQDVTSHVDFTSLRRAGESVGLATLGLVSQRTLLRRLGLDELRQALTTIVGSQNEREAELRALDALVDPVGLGRILALVQHRGLDGFAPIGLVGGPAVHWEPLPRRRPEHLRLPDPSEGEALLDFESQWAELWSGEQA